MTQPLSKKNEGTSIHLPSALPPYFRGTPPPLIGTPPPRCPAPPLGTLQGTFSSVPSTSFRHFQALHPSLALDHPPLLVTSIEEKSRLFSLLHPPLLGRLPPVRLVCYCRTTSSSTAPCTSRRMCFASTSPRAFASTSPQYPSTFAWYSASLPLRLGTPSVSPGTSPSTAPWYFHPPLLVTTTSHWSFRPHLIGIPPPLLGTFQALHFASLLHHPPLLVTLQLSSVFPSTSLRHFTRLPSHPRTVV